MKGPYLAPGEISAPQSMAIDALLAGSTFIEAAKRAGVTRSALEGWRTKPEFVAELERRRAIVAEETVDRLRALVPKAITLWEKALDAELKKDSPDWRVAAHLLRLIGPIPGFPTVQIAVIQNGAADDGPDDDPGGVVVEANGHMVETEPAEPRPKSMAELRERNLKAWQKEGIIVGSPYAVSARQRVASGRQAGGRVPAAQPHAGARRAGEGR